MINLLPPELTVSRGFTKLTKTLKTLNFFLITGFLIFGLGILGFFIFSSFELRSLTQRQESLKESIKERETVEQRLVLLKDRLGKIKVANASESVTDELDALSTVLGNIGESSSISELEGNSQRIDLSILFRNSADLSSFLSRISSLESFKSILITSFGFNPTSGYLVSFRLTGGNAK